MTAADLTEKEIVNLLLHAPSSFEQIVSELANARKLRKEHPGSRTTISIALKSLYHKGFVDYNPESHLWHVTSLGRWIVGEGLIPTEPASALSHVTQPLLNAVEEKPEKLIKLLSTMFVYSAARSDKFSPEEKRILKDTETRLSLFTSEYPAAVEAIWGDGVELMIGHFSSLMAAILLHRSSLDREYKTEVSDIIPKITEQFCKPLMVELGRFLSNYLADLDKLSDLERRLEKKKETPRVGKTPMKPV